MEEAVSKLKFSGTMKGIGASLGELGFVFCTEDTVYKIMVASECSMCISAYPLIS